MIGFIKQKLNNLRVKARERFNPLLANKRRKRLKSTDFTIICNNCWGGHVYRYYGLPYNSPTIGLFFYAEDFVKFCSNLRHYLTIELKFIDYTESKYKDDLLIHNNIRCPIGKLDDIEVIFLHYKSKEEAKEKWNRRCKRVNFDNLIFKMSYQNLCNVDILKLFDALSEMRKIVFVTKDYGLKSQIIWKSEHKDEVIPIDTVDFRKFVNLDKLINGEL